MKKVSTLLHIVAWALAIAAIVLVVVSFDSVFSQFAHFETAWDFFKATFTTKLPSIFGLNEDVSWSKVANSFWIFACIIFLTVVFAILTSINSKEDTSKFKKVFLVSQIVLGLVVAIESVTFGFYKSFSWTTLSSRDGYGLVLFAFDLSEMKEASFEGDKVFKSILPVICIYASFASCFVSMILRLLAAKTVTDEEFDFADEKETKYVRATAPKPVKKPNKPNAGVFKAKPESTWVKVIRVPFVTRLLDSDKSLQRTYSELKSYILSYDVGSRISNSGDFFRAHTKTYIKITVAGKSLKLYYALDPKAYSKTTIPFNNAGKKKLYADIPFEFKVKSGLSLRRAKQLVDDVMKKDNIPQGEQRIQDWIKFLK